MSTTTKDVKRRQNFRALQGASDGNDNGKKPAVQDLTYWLNVEFSVFKVENTLFRVPNYQFIRESSFFSTMFALPQDPENMRQEGRTPENPIIVPSVRAEDFRNLLMALYPVDGQLLLSPTTWISVLKLSTVWFMLTYRSAAISRLCPPGILTSVQKIMFGRECKVSQWVIEGYQEIIERDDSITDPEAIAIGPLQCVALGRQRETKWRTTVNKRGHTNWRTIILGQFASELIDIQTDEQAYRLELVSDNGSSAK